MMLETGRSASSDGNPGDNRDRGSRRCLAPKPCGLAKGFSAAGLIPLLHAIPMIQGGHVHAQLHRP